MNETANPSPDFSTLIRILALAGVVILSLAHGVLFPSAFHDIDEATYGMDAKLLLGGATLYHDILETKPPGIFLIYALGMSVDPSSMIGIRVLGFVAMGVVIFLTLTLLSRLMPRKEALLLGTGVLILLFVHTGFESEAMLTELFSLPFLLLFMVRAHTHLTQFPPHSLMSGVLTGLMGSLAIFFSLHAALPVFLVGVLVVWKKIPVLTLLGGGIIPWAGVVAYLFFRGVPFSDLRANGDLFHLYASTYFSSGWGLQNLASYAWTLAGVIFIALLGFFLFFRENKKEIGWFVAWGTGFAITLVGVGSFFPHHWMMVLPLVGVGLTLALHAFFFPRVRTHVRAQLVAGFFLSVLVVGSTVGAVTHFRWSPEPSSLSSLGRYIEATTTPADTIFVLGYRYELYHYAHRLLPLHLMHEPGLLLALLVQPERVDARDLDPILTSQDGGPPAVIIVANPDLIRNAAISEFLEKNFVKETTPYGVIYRRSGT